jgi:hypothetical protein
MATHDRAPAFAAGRSDALCTTVTCALVQAGGTFAFRRNRFVGS